MKKVSLMLIFIIVINLLTFNFAVTNAASESLDQFNFNDIAYSATLNMFIATANVGAKGYILASADTEKWGVVQTFSSNNVGYSDNDSVIWWESQGVFAVYTKSPAQIWISTDGYSWYNSNMSNILSSGGITNDGTNLLNYGGSKLRIFSNFTDYEETTYTTISSMYASIAAAAGSGSDKTLIGIASYRGSVSTDGGATWTVVNSFAAYGTIKDIAYSENQDCFYTAVATQGWKISKIERNGTITGASNIIGIGSARSNAIETGGGKMVIGTDDGKLYWAPDDSSFSVTSTEWTQIPSADENANTAPIKRIVYGNGKFVGISNKNVSSAISLGAIVTMNEDMTSYKKITEYNTTPYNIVIEGESSIEIPSGNGSDVTFDYTAKIVDLKNDIFGNDSIASFAPTSLPDGITFNNGQLKVSSSAAGCKVTLRATSQKGLTGDFVINCVKETSVEIDGYFNLAIPAYGDPNESWVFSAKVLDNEGNEMQSRSAAITMTTPLLDGASFDTAASTLTLSYNTVAGEMKIKAVSNSEPSIFTEKTITVKERTPASVEVTSGMNTAVIPDTNTKTVKYTAVVKDQTDKLMPNLSVVWSVAPAVEGVSINAQTGDLTISNITCKSNIVIKASVSTATSVFADYPVELTYSDLRSVIEDKNILTISGDLTKVSSNLVLPAATTYGSTVTWVSSAPSLITNLGVVTQATDGDKQVTLTATVSKGSSSMTKSFNITVLKLDNILKNGGFEEADISLWKAAGGAAVALDSASPHLGSNSLLVSARPASTAGATQEVTLKNNSTYLFEGYVKGKTDNEKIALTTKESSYAKIAEVTASADNFTKISGTYTYTNKNTSFTDIIEVSTRFGGGTDDFYLDDFKLFEITVELNALMAAIQKAEYSKTEDDINEAKDLLSEFYDTPLKDELEDRINDIEPKKTDGGGSGGGGGGSSKGHSSASVSIPANAVAIPDNTEKVSDYLLVFKDLKNHWAKDDVEFMAKKGFVNGVDEGTFSPEKDVTRAEFVALIIRTMCITPAAYENSFYDVVEEDWYSGYVQAARNLGLVVGSNGLFRPDGNITREEMTKIIVLAYNQKTKAAVTKGGALYYNDIYNISSWAYDFIVSAVNLELVNGVTEDTFSPLTSATRAQAVVILKRLYDKTMTE